MNASIISSLLAGTILFAPMIFTGCESDGGSTHGAGNNYYGTGFNNPWYYGGYNDDPDVIIVPPSPGKPPDNGLRPTHPIASPPPAARPVPRPLPSIPSTPRPAPRSAGRR